MSTRGGQKDDGRDGRHPMKSRWDLLPAIAIKEIVAVLTKGAEKYAPEGWRDVPDPRERYFAAMQRHIWDWRAGEIIDGEWGLHHLAHAGACLVFLLTLDLENKAAVKSESRDSLSARGGAHGKAG